MISVVILVDGAVHGNRSWSSVPAVGHTVELDAGGGKLRSVVVTGVIWRKPTHPGDCLVDLQCSTVTLGKPTRRRQST